MKYLKYFESSEFYYEISKLEFDKFLINSDNVVQEVFDSDEFQKLSKIYDRTARGRCFNGMIKYLKGTESESRYSGIRIGKSEDLNPEVDYTNPEMDYMNYLEIFKIKDEWYVVKSITEERGRIKNGFFTSNKIGYYKCDQWEGLTHLLKNKGYGE